MPAYSDRRANRFRRSVASSGSHSTQRLSWFGELQESDDEPINRPGPRAMEKTGLSFS